jgi:hypothetical protein
MTNSDSNSEGEVRPEAIFDALREKLGKKALSMQLTDFDETNLLLNAKGMCSANVRAAEDLSDESCFRDVDDPRSLKTVTYDDTKYILIKGDSDSGIDYLLYHSVTPADNRESRRGMFLAILGELYLVVTCAHNHLQAVNQEILSSLLGMLSFEE